MIVSFTEVLKILVGFYSPILIYLIVYEMEKFYHDYLKNNLTRRNLIKILIIFLIASAKPFLHSKISNPELHSHFEKKNTFIPKTRLDYLSKNQNRRKNVKIPFVKR